MDNWLVVGFTNEDGVDLYIHGDVISSYNECISEVALLEIESFDPFTPIAYSDNDQIHLTLNGEIISISEDICSPVMEKELIIWALINEPTNKPHYNILDIVNKNSFKIEYAA
tara:strand:+ start:207 stop:545 length:339 start_codon:yes stop_codon:yes gene_type:complete